MSVVKAGPVTLLSIISIGVWGLAIFFFFTNEDTVPVENHASNQIQQVDKEQIMYKNKRDIVQELEIVNLKDLNLKLKSNRVSIDELLAALTQEE